MAHNRLEEGGWAREVTVRDLPVAKSMAGVNMRLDPGAIRELHWHKEAEWAYILEGNVRFTVVDQDRNVYIDDLKPGDMWLRQRASLIQFRAWTAAANSSSSLMTAIFRKTRRC